jgi:hypothetical protein
MKQLKRWKYKNLTFFFLSLLLAFFIFQNEAVHSYLQHLGKLGYIGAFLSGILFVSTFTVSSSMIILLVLAETLSPLEIGIVAGAGAVVGDLIIFRFVKNDMAREMKQIYHLFDKKHHIKKVLHTKYFSWTLPVVGALMIASPLPDELGVSLMGLSKLHTSKFLVLSFLLNSLGILFVVVASLVIKP